MAKPVVPTELIEQTAKSIKYSEIYELKLNEYMARAEKRDRRKKGSKKEKKGKKPGEKKNAIAPDSNETDKTRDVPDIVITDQELEYDYFDLYPAEMVYWRSMEPYYIKANFTCVIRYDPFSQKRDRLYLTTMCKVTRPDFSTNLKTQRLDFGTCLVGTTTTNVIMAQNITYKNIKPEISLLNPVGSFSVPCLKNVSVPPEHYLRLPLEFRPTSSKKVIEYIEIKSNATVIPLILCGEGCVPIVNVSPHFEVFRLETKQSKLAELQLKIDNSSEAPAKIEFDKLFEIEALLVDVIKKDDKLESNVKEENKKPKTKKEPAEKHKKGTKKLVKYSDSLTDKELDTIQNHFKKIKGESHFDLRTKEGPLNLRPKEHHTVTIFCGEPEAIKKKKSPTPKKGKKVEAEVEITSKPSGLRSYSTVTKKPNEDKQYIAQYNVRVGEVHIKSIILICTIKC